MSVPIITHGENNIYRAPKLKRTANNVHVLFPTAGLTDVNFRRVLDGRRTVKLTAVGDPTCRWNKMNAGCCCLPCVERQAHGKDLFCRAFVGRRTAKI